MRPVHSQWPLPLANAWLAIVVMSALAGQIVGAENIDVNKLRDRCEKRTFTGAAGGTLPYRLFLPADYDPTKRYPLILFLHGAGERGTDNEGQLRHADALRLVADPDHPAILVAPQCPNGAQWVEVPWGAKTPHTTPAEPSKPLGLTLELLDALDKELAIDPDRRYVTGLSMGGFGTFDAVVRRPNYFAAAVPICGGADDGAAGKIAHVPMWAFHGDKDTAVHTVRSQSAVTALKKAGAKPRYTEYPGKGHNVWGVAYAEPELPTWLFQQRREK